MNRLTRVGFVLAAFGTAFGSSSPGLLLVLAGLFSDAAKGRRSLDLSNPVYGTFTVFMAAMGLSVFTSPVKSVAAGLTAGFAMVLVGFVFCARAIADDEDYLRRRLLPALVLGSVAANSFAVANFLITHPKRASVPAAGANGLGTLVILCTGVGLGYLETLKFKGKRWFQVAFLALSGATLLFSYSRGAWFGFLGMLGVFALLNPSLRRWAWAGVAGILGVMVAIPSFAARLASAVKVSENLSRVYIWRAALRMIAAYPVTGVGAGVYLYVSEHFALPGAKYRSVAFAHNLFLQVAAEFGLVGFLVFAVLLSQILFMAWRLAKTGQPLYQGLLATLVGVLVHQMVDIPIWGLQIGGSFWLLVGLVIGLYDRAFRTPLTPLKGCDTIGMSNS